MLLQQNIDGGIKIEVDDNHVSIPQAVGAVATINILNIVRIVYCFNTASGRCCCNGLVDAAIDELKMIPVVSIPQAVGAVATEHGTDFMKWLNEKFQYRKR